MADGTLEKLQNIFRDQLDNDAIVLELSSSPDSVEGWDSMANFRLILAIEKEFNVRFTDFSYIRTVQDIIDVVNRQK